MILEYYRKRMKYLFYIILCCSFAFSQSNRFRVLHTQTDTISPFTATKNITFPDTAYGKYAISDKDSSDILVPTRYLQRQIGLLSNSIPSSPLTNYIYPKDSSSGNVKDFITDSGNVRIGMKYHLPRISFDTVLQKYYLLK